MAVADPNRQLHTEVLFSDGTATLRKYTLRSTGLDAEPTSAEVGSGSLSVGQSEANDVQVRDPSVSRFHFELVRRGSSLVIRDLGSTNGTQVEGVFVHEARISPGQRIRVGRAEFVVETESEPSRVEAYPEARLGALVGGSLPMRLLYAQIARAAQSDATALVLGESGTGKELVAQEIHDHSARKNAPFIIVDCGALPEDLIESELFGHERGAFTGAVADRPGAFESATGGTLFLDEIGELPLPLQPKLLRAIETKTIKRVGSNHRRPIDVRFVAATNRDLRAEVNAGTFREDLYWRLSVLQFRIPPLRERTEDIAALVEAFWARSGMAQPMTIDQETMARLTTLPWRGNVRELRNFVERAVVMGAPEMPARTIENPPYDAPQTAKVHTELPFKDAKEQWVDLFEQVYLEDRLVAAEGNLSRMAREAEMDRAYLFKLLKKHKLR